MSDIMLEALGIKSGSRVIVTFTETCFCKNYIKLSGKNLDICTKGQSLVGTAQSYYKRREILELKEATTGYTWEIPLKNKRQVVIVDIQLDGKPEEDPDGKEQT